MINRFWMIPPILFAISGCASTATYDELPKSVPQETVKAPEKAKPTGWDAETKTAPAPVKQTKLVAPKTPVQTQKTPAPRVVQSQTAPLNNTVALTPGMFANANTAPSVTQPVRIVPAPQQIASVAPPVQVQRRVVAAQPTPAYVAAPAPAYVAAPVTTQQPVRVLPQASIPQSVPSLGLPPQSTGPKPMKFLSKLEQGGDAPDGAYGYVLIDAQSGRTLSERNADMPLPPASIAKLLAAIAILDAKGPDGRFRTALHADGPINDGVLKGNLHMVGSGDPSLNRTDLSNLGRRLAAAGVRKVEGNFYYHGDALPEVSQIDANQPRGAIYNPGISGLNLEYNEHRGASPVSNPAKYTADAMVRAARSAGIDLPTPRKGRGAVRGQEIAFHDSGTVSEILTVMFDISRNMTSEVLGAAAAGILVRKPTSLRDAANINAQWARSEIGSIGGSEWAGFDFVNNSGLSTRSRATPRQMAAFVRHGYLRYGDQFKRVYEEQSSGNSAGVDFAIRAKIGTMSYVRGLGGIISVGGRDMVFAIMATDPSRRAGAKNWMGKARRLEQALMSDWLQNNWPSRTRTAGL